MLADLLDQVVEAGIAACRSAHDAALEVSGLRAGLLVAQTEWPLWVTEGLRERAEALTFQAARLLLWAHAASEQAEGVVRAVGFARVCEVWTPRDLRADEEALFGPVNRRLG